MDGGPGTDLGTLGWFLGVWVVMMAAMMFPVVGADHRVVCANDPPAWLEPPASVHCRVSARVGGGGTRRLRAVSRGPERSRRRSGLAHRRALVRRRRPRRRGDLRADASEGRVPRKVPQPAGVPARNLARREPRRARDGIQARRLVPGLLLGADGRAVRARSHEHHLDGVHRRAHHAREDDPVAPGSHLGLRSRCSSLSRSPLSRYRTRSQGW